MVSERDYLVHVTGYRPDGLRVNRRYKTAEAAQRMARTMSIVHVRYLRAVFIDEDMAFDDDAILKMLDHPH